MEWVTEVHEHFSLFSFFFNEKEKKKIGGCSGLYEIIMCLNVIYGYGVHNIVCGV